jgi:hypothetical protein
MIPTNSQSVFSEQNISDKGTISVYTEMHLLGIGQTTGGGYITWHITGEAARDLRLKVAAKYDTSPRDGKLSFDEIYDYVGNEKAVETFLKTYKPAVKLFGLEITGYKPVHDPSPLSTDVSGLDADLNSTTDIEINWIYECKTLREGYYEINLINDIFIQALYKPLGADVPEGVKCKISHTQYTLGLHSISNFKGTGSFIVVRTPVGEIYKYNTDFIYPAKSEDVPVAQATFATFNFIENPQVLFIILIIFSWLIFFVASKFYQKYRDKFVNITGTQPKRIWWLHLIVFIMVCILWLTYFFAGLWTVFFSGVFIWVSSIIFLVITCVSSKYVYDWAASKITPPVAAPQIPKVSYERPTPVSAPPPVPPPAPPPTQIPVYQPYKTYEKPAEQIRKEVPPSPPAPPAPPTPPPPPLEMLIKKGYNNLILDDTPSTTYEAFAGFLEKGVGGLCITTTYPAKLRKDYNFANTDVDIVWISRSVDKDAIDPKRLDFEIARAINNFVKSKKGGMILLDGLEYLIVENGLDNVLKFLKKTTDLSSIYECTLLVLVNPNSLKIGELVLLKKEFDEIIELVTEAKEE